MSVASSAQIVVQHERAREVYYTQWSGCARPSLDGAAKCDEAREAAARTFRGVGEIKGAHTNTRDAPK